MGRQGLYKHSTWPLQYFVPNVHMQLLPVDGCDPMFVYRNYYNCRFLRIMGEKDLLLLSEPHLPLRLHFSLSSLTCFFNVYNSLQIAQGLPLVVWLELVRVQLGLTNLFLCSPLSRFCATVDIKPDVPLAVDPLSPLDLRTDLRMLGPGSDPGLWERQLQQELLLIQKQQQIQKQLLISEFQKQHEKLTRQHQAQLQEHLKVSFEQLHRGTVAQHSTTQNNRTQHGI